MIAASRTDRWAAAFSLLGWIERRSEAPGTWRRQPYRVEGQHAVRAGVRPRDLTRPVSGMARHVPKDAPQVLARCRADVVRLGKFDVDEVVRFRAFHSIEVEPAALRVQARGDPTQPGIERDIGARIMVARHVPELAPPLYDHAVYPRRSVAYLREGIVVGRHPRDPDEVLSLVVPPLVSGLARLYAGVGVAPRRLSSLVSGQLLERWEGVARTAELSEVVVAAVRSLVARDANLEVSLGHGDLVRTNLMITGDTVVLVDWEHASEMPIAFDLAKPVFLSEDADAAVDLVRRGLAGIVAVPADSYTLEEQLALALVQMLSWSTHREARAASAGRSDLLAQDTARRLTLLERLLA